MAKGIKTGGRQKGTTNKRTAEYMAGLLESGLDPLEFMLSVMRDEEEDKHLRCDMAKSVARYFYAVPSDGGINMNITGDRLNGKGNGAEHEGITVRFVRPQHIGDD
jgi:hypothetical protein